jgi:hypothetical protein
MDLSYLKIIIYLCYFSKLHLEIKVNVGYN